ncbi:MAG: hypothetical protein JXQ73_10585 [Phycisphaerae bacterium]|nr:hypothetical protein [Phycisphaerae bacterium]
MKWKRTERIGAATFMFGAACGLALWQAAQLGRDGPSAVSLTAVATAATPDDDLNYQLARDFISWIEARYVDNMQRVNGQDTTVAHCVKAIGVAKAVQRYAAVRQVDLDYALKYPDDDPIPESHLSEIAAAKYQLVAANTSFGKQWIDFRAEPLKDGVVEVYRREAKAWVSFYRKLLATPVPPETTDFRILIRASHTREEYERFVSTIAGGLGQFYGALKKGVTWYAPWAPLVNRTIDATHRKSHGLWLETPELIYSVPEQDEPPLTESELAPPRSSPAPADP